MLNVTTVPFEIKFTSFVRVYIKGYDQYIKDYDQYIKGSDQYMKGYDKYMKGYYKCITGYDNYINAYDKYTKDFFEKIFTNDEYISRILHGGEKIWILCSSGKNNMSRVSAANEWDIVLATRTKRYDTHKCDIRKIRHSGPGWSGVWRLRVV